MPGSPLFDTNAAIAWIGGDTRLQSQFLGRDIAISVVTVGELRYGASHSKDAAENHQGIDRALRYFTVFPIVEGVATGYGKIKAALRSAGTPIPDNDLWIAATAIEHGATLVSRDAHFARVEGLQVLDW